MLTISRMKSILTPTLSAFTFQLPKTTHLALLTSKSFPCNPNPTTTLLPLKPTTLSPTCSIHSIQSRDVHMEPATLPPEFPGEIHVIVGPMFAGKTTTLLRRIQSESSNGSFQVEPYKSYLLFNKMFKGLCVSGRLREAVGLLCTVGVSVAIIKSNKDTRYGLDSIVTHDGAKLPCLALPDLSSFRQKFGLDAYDKLDVIGIDEAQFFEDLYDFCREAADNDGKTVIVAGLDGDYLRRSFGSVLDIIPLADSVTKLTSHCELCGKRAFFTLRKTEEAQTELIGGADVYMPVCRKHYVSGQVVMEAARTVLESQNIPCVSYA